MNLLDVMTAPWAITPEKLVEIRGVYDAHLRGEPIDIAAVEARLGVPLDNLPQGYEVINGTAVIPIHGVIARRMNLFSQVSGGVSTELIQRDVLAAIGDETVNRIILNIDSPGGAVDGTAELARTIFEARGKKPIIALANGTMASAAYWIGSAADSLFISGPTAQVGSIGIIATHIDKSQANAQQGIKVTEVTAGKYKGLASPNTALSQASRDGIQAQVDYLYGVFVETVAKHRGVSVETVLSNMADGRVFIGNQAVEAGLVDRVATLDQLIMKEQGMENQITTASLQAEHGVVYDAVLAEGHNAGKEAGYKTGLEEGQQAGAEAERQRIQSILEIQVAGFDELVGSAIADGKTTGPEVAMEILKVNKARGVSLDDLAAESQLAGAAHPGADDTDEQERAELVGAMAAGTGRKKEV